MPSSETITQDIELALVVPLAVCCMIPFWLILYAVLEDPDGPIFDDTFWRGVNATELDHFGGVVDNVAAQSFWRCFMLLAVHLLCPAFPMSAAALLAGSGRFSASRMDEIGTIMAGILFLVGIYETIWDDDNGVGIWFLVNSTVLLIFTVPRVLQPVEDSKHIMMGRACYQEKEEGPKDLELPESESDNTESIEPNPVV
jgi:hypothetical protein